METVLASDTSSAASGRFSAVARLPDSEGWSGARSLLSHRGAALRGSWHDHEEEQGRVRRSEEQRGGESDDTHARTVT